MDEDLKAIAHDWSFSYVAQHAHETPTYHARLSDANRAWIRKTFSEDYDLFEEHCAKCAS